MSQRKAAKDRKTITPPGEKFLNWCVRTHTGEWSTFERRMFNRAIVTINALSRKAAKNGKG